MSEESGAQSHRARTGAQASGPQGARPGPAARRELWSSRPSPRSFIAVENIDRYCVLISSKAVYFLKSGDYVDREAIFLEVKYDDLYHCLVSRDHGKVYVQVTRKAVNTSSGVSIPGPSQQKPMVSVRAATPPSRTRVQGVRDRAQGAPCPAHTSERDPLLVRRRCC